MGFPNQVNLNPPIGIEGGWASASNTRNVLAGTAQYVADTTGVLIGRFAYANAATGKASYVKPASMVNVQVGFIARGTNAGLVTAWLGSDSMVIPAGYGVTLTNNGDFFVKTSTAATIGQAVFQNDTTGVISTGTAGATVAGATEIPLFKVASVGAADSLIKIQAL